MGNRGRDVSTSPSLQNLTGTIFPILQSLLGLNWPCPCPCPRPLLGEFPAGNQGPIYHLYSQWYCSTSLNCNTAIFCIRLLSKIFLSRLFFFSILDFISPHLDLTFCSLQEYLLSLDVKEFLQLTQL
jgi:hypothetical protein